MDAADVEGALSCGELRLSGRQLQVVPSSLLACCGLLLLDLSANSLAGLPRELSELKSLTCLDVSFNQLRELPACISALTHLTCLRASYNQIGRLHAHALEGLAGSLQELHLGDNSLTAAGLPPQIGLLTRLCHLDLRYNHLLSSLPPELGRLAAVASGTGLGSEFGEEPKSAAPADQPPNATGCLRYLGLEGCPLGSSCRSVARPGTAGGAGPGRAAAQQQEQQRAEEELQLYQRLQAAAAAVEEAGAAGRVAAASEAEAQRGLAEALRQLLRLAPTSPLSASSEGTTRSCTSARTGAVAGVNSNLASGLGLEHKGCSYQVTAMACAVTATRIGCNSAGEAIGGGAGSGRGPDGAEGPNHDSGTGRIDPGARRQPHVRVLILQEATRDSSEDPPDHPTGCCPRSPLTDLRNSHADLELSYMDGDEDDAGGPGTQGINIVGRGAGEGAAQQRPLSAVVAGGGDDRPGGGAVAAALAAALEDLSDLPPAAAAAMYRSLDVVAGGVQEIREGRPLSRGGCCHSQSQSHPQNTRAAATGPGAGPFLRPASHRQPRPGSSSFRPDSSGRSGAGSAPHRPRTSAAAVSRPGSAAGPSLGVPGGGSGGHESQRPPLTGALALLADAGMGLGGGTGQLSGGGGSSTRLLPRDTGGVSGAGVGGGGGGLGSLAPITFPLASGVRGMLRGAGAAVNSAKLGASAAATALAMVGSPALPGGAAAAGGCSRRDAAEHSGRGNEAAAMEEADCAGQAEIDTLAADWDRLAVVRRLLAGRNPELLKALDETVFEAEDGEEGEGEEEGAAAEEEEQGMSPSC